MIIDYKRFNINFKGYVCHPWSVKGLKGTVLDQGWKVTWNYTNAYKFKVSFFSDSEEEPAVGESGEGESGEGEPGEGKPAEVSNLPIFQR